MDANKQFVLIMVSIMGSFALFGGLGYAVFAWLKMRAQGPVSGNAVRQLHDQLAHLQTSVDTMSIELERISEAQRFTTKVLTDRPEATRIERGGPAH